MTELIDVSGGRDIAVTISEFSRAREAYLDMSFHLKRLADRTRECTHGLARPRGAYQMLAFDHFLPRMSISFGSTCDELMRLSLMCHELAGSLREASRLYVESELANVVVFSGGDIFGIFRTVINLSTPFTFGVPNFIDQAVNDLFDALGGDRTSRISRLWNMDHMHTDKNVLIESFLYDKQKIVAVASVVLLAYLKVPLLGATGYLDYLDATNEDYDQSSMPVLARTVLNLLETLGVIDNRPIKVNKVSAFTDAPPINGAPELLRALKRLAKYGDEKPGSIEIRQLRGEDGKQRWIVMVPGTQEDMDSITGDGQNPLDWNSNINLLGRQSSDSMVMTYLAMRQAGIPSGDPVLMVGHSQGGLVVTAAAAEDSIFDRYNITGVLTAGSPVGAGFTPRTSAQVLSLEHKSDWVPQLDGGYNPATPNWTTVEIDHLYSDDTHDIAAAYDSNRSHTLDEYIRTAHKLEEYNYAQTDGWHVEMKDFFTENATLVQATRYQGERIPETEPTASSGGTPVGDAEDPEGQCPAPSQSSSTVNTILNQLMKLRLGTVA